MLITQTQMVEREDIIRIAGEELGDGELFLVDVKVSAGNEVEVFIDSDSRVSVEDCVRLTKAIESHFDREVEDFSLTVSSAGIGQPLRVDRQYRKLIGRSVEVVLTGGTKFMATLEGADGEGITVSYAEKQKLEGKKRPEVVTVTKTFPFTEIKTTKEYIDFK